MEYHIDFIDQLSKGVKSIVLSERKYKHLSSELVYKQDGNDVMVVLRGIYRGTHFEEHDEIIGGLWDDEYYELANKFEL